jgi:hypothetical protein
MTRAFILDSNKQDVQIGNKIFHLRTGKVETTQANRKGIFLDCEAYVEVPFKSAEAARLAITLIEPRPQDHR